MLLHIPAMFSDVWSKIEGVIPEHRNGSGKYFWTITDWTDSIAVYYIYIYIYILYILLVLDCIMYKRTLGQACPMQHCHYNKSSCS